MCQTCSRGYGADMEDTALCVNTKGAPHRAELPPARFAPEARSVRQVRRLIADFLRDRGAADAVDAAELVVAELAANAVRHARTPFVLRARIDGRSVQIEVTDTGPGRPVVRHPASHAVTGRGMLIVERLCVGWGTRARRNGKSVWAELARDRSPFPL